MNPQRTLIGSTFPLSLVRRRVVIVPETIARLQAQLGARGVEALSVPGRSGDYDSTSPAASATLIPS